MSKPWYSVDHRREYNKDEGLQRLVKGLLALLKEYVRMPEGHTTDRSV